MGPELLDVHRLLNIISELRKGGVSPAERMVHLGVNEVDDEELVAAVLAVLADEPHHIDTWQGWSHDKRWSPSPFLDELTVGHYDGGNRVVRRHKDLASACADFVLAEVRWIVEERVVGE